ncbi:MAG: class I SAM-dependent methyltransferase [Nitrospirota bacterium]
MEGAIGHAVKENEGIRVQEARSCLLSNNEGILLYQNLRDRLFGAPGTWALMQCPKCRLVWLSPRPVPADIGKLYEHYFTHDTTNCVPRLASLKHVVRDTILATRLGYDGLACRPLPRRLGKVLSWIGPIREIVELSVMTLKKTPRGKLLDVGCASGQFLVKMRDLGWEVVGVEPDGQAVKVARERFDLSVHEGVLEEAGFPDNTFDAITMNHVIEHVLDPIATLKECRRVVKPDGKLVVITPNIESLGHRLFGKAWRGLEVPRHLYLFSRDTLWACAEQAGLQVIKVWTTPRSARWIWVASRLIHQNGVLHGGSPQKQSCWLWLAGLAFQAVEHGLCRVRDVGEEIVLVATKEGS